MTKLKVLDDLYQQHVNGELTYDEWTSRVAEALRAAEDRKIKGTAGTHRLGDVADESRGAHRRKSDLLTVVADAPQAEDIREVLMFRTTSKHWDPESFVAAFDGHMLADVYFARLIKKSIVSTEFVLVDLPYHYPDRDPYIESSDFSITIPGLSERVDVGVGKMYLETAIELSPNYNSIEFDRGSTWADAYDKSKRVEWFIGRVLAPEEIEVMKAREREAEEARIREKVETFYTRDLHSLHVIKGNQMAGSVVEAVVNKRGLIEVVWMEEDGRLRRLTHTGSKVDAIASGRMITTLTLEEGLQLDGRMVSEADARDAITTTQRGAVRIQNGSSLW